MAPAVARTTRRGDLDAVLLIALAGFTDVVGFIALHHLFVSFMSGNTTQFGIALVGGDGPTMRLAAAVVLCFVAGTVGGEVLHALSPRWPLVLLAEMVCFGLALGGGWLVACAVAMGGQNAIRRRIGGRAQAKTFLTGTLVSFGQALGDAVAADDASVRRRALADAGANGFAWLVFLAGGIAAATIVKERGGIDGALWIGLGLLAMLILSNLSRRGSA